MGVHAMGSASTDTCLSVGCHVMARVNSSSFIMVGIELLLSADVRSSEVEVVKPL
ncbi:MAG: hypothetical protein WA364_03755 [Candidatus Nitrosopolaris sp.]|jgi:hypothetical protein